MAYTGPAELLATWEAGLAHPAPERALLLHRAARPDAGTDALLSVPAGEREADLLGLRRALFGDRMQVLVECGACGEGMEFDLDARELLAAQALDGPQAAGRPPRSDEPLRVVADGWAVEFRLPTVADLTAAARTAEARTADPAAGTGEDAVGTARAAARQVLLKRCVISALRDGRPVPADRLRQLPDSVQRLLAEAAERADPAAAVTLNIACPECGEATPAELDIATHLWTELDAWARDLMLDVHLLATAYGWSEPEILALSPLRRRYYLELCADA